MQKKLKNKKVKIVMTGGHAASSAFVVVEEIRSQKKPWDIFWIGSKSAIEGEDVSTLSSVYFPKYSVKTYDIVTGRIQRKLTRHTIPSLIKIPVGFVHAYFLLKKIKPDVILSFGGFSAFPVVVVGFILRIPIILHEQTSVAGRANIFSSFFANKIAISRQTSKIYFPAKKLVFTGNPVPGEITDFKANTFLPKRPLVFVTGGQSGSSTINEALGKILVSLLKEYKVIHLTGTKQEEKFKTIRQKMTKKLKERYTVYGIVDPRKYNKLFSSSALVVSRAGANTVSKVIASHKPAILIPLPISYLQEQQKNALFAQKYANSVVLAQDELTHERLLSEIKNLTKEVEKARKPLPVQKNPDIGAAERIVSLIGEYLE